MQMSAAWGAAVGGEKGLFVGLNGHAERGSSRRGSLSIVQGWAQVAGE